MRHRALLIFCVLWLGLAEAGCSILSPTPLWELAKAAGSVTATAMPYGPSKAKNTVYHLHAPVKNVCIEFNPDANVEEVVPALQIELRNHQIDSRVYESYESARSIGQCEVWLKYTAYVAWGVPPMGEDFRPYVSSASLTLQASDGLVLSSSDYEADRTFGRGRWASTQSKLAPVVTALLTGF